MQSIPAVNQYLKPILTVRQTCKLSMNIPEPNSSTHIYHCEPYCSQCYYRDLCRRYIAGAPGPEKLYSWEKPKKCVCRTGSVTTAVARSVCKFCSRMDQHAAVRVREERDKAEVKHLVQQQLRCKGCTKGLNKGRLRWWGCSLCMRECVSDVHPMWDEKKRL